MRNPVCAIAVLAFASAALTAQTYRSAEIDLHGKLTIISTSGAKIIPPMLDGQQSFGAARISPDNRTVGWLALYPYPFAGGNQSPIASKLLIYREGRVLRTISTDQVFWDWRFEDHGRKVAYSTGPTHGGAAECVLFDIDAGKTTARWFVRDGQAPGWVADLRR